MEVGKMNEQQYREAIKRTMNTELGFDERLAMLALGLAGECGEIVDSIKKVVYHGHELDYNDLVKEFGDIEWYLQHLKMLFHIDNDIVRQRNVDKLLKRYPDGFSEQASIERADQ